MLPIKDTSICPICHRISNVHLSFEILFNLLERKYVKQTRAAPN